MWLCKAFLLQMQPNLVFHIKFVSQSVLIMVFLYIVLDFLKISWICWQMNWIFSINLVYFSASDWTCENSSYVVVKGNVTSMGLNGWNPNNPPERGCRQLNCGEMCCSCVEHRGDSHPMCGCLELYMHKMCMIILLTTFVWPSTWGWKAVDFLRLLFNNDQRLDQNTLRNPLSWFDLMIFGIPKCTNTCFKKSLVVAFTMILFL